PDDEQGRLADNRRRARRDLSGPAAILDDVFLHRAGSWFAGEELLPGTAIERDAEEPVEHAAVQRPLRTNQETEVGGRVVRAKRLRQIAHGAVDAGKR